MHFSADLQKEKLEFSQTSAYRYAYTSDDIRLDC